MNLDAYTAALCSKAARYLQQRRVIEDKMSRCCDESKQVVPSAGLCGRAV